MISLAEYVKQLPSKVFLEHFSDFIGSNGGILSESRIKRMLDQFVHSDEPLKRFATLADAQKIDVILGYILADKGFEDGSRENQRALARTFLVACSQFGQDNDAALHGFTELKPKLLEAMKEFIGAGKLCSAPERKLWGQYHELCDLAVLLGGIASSHVQWTKTGSLTKSTRLYLKKILHCWRSRWGTDNYHTVSMLTDFLGTQGLLIKNEQTYKVSADAENFFVNHDTAQIRKELRHYICTQHLGLDVEMFFALFPPVEDPGSWYNCPALTQCPAFVKILRMLEACALVVVCSSADALLFRPVPQIEDEQTTTPTILADFSVFVGPEVTPQLLYSLHALMQFTTFDRVYKGHISQAIINDSLARFATAEDIQSLLQQFKAPNNVWESVKEWIRQFERISFFEGNALLVNDPGVAEQLAQHPEFHSLLEHIPIASFFRFKNKHTDFVRQKLAELGFDLRAPQRERPGTPVEELVRFYPDRGTTFKVNELVFQDAALVKGQGNKYGAELKKREISELLHVLEYAVLMNNKVRFSYRGSPYIKSGEYTVWPLNFTRGANATFEARIVGAKSTAKHFVIESIDKIGIVEENPEEHE